MLPMLPGVFDGTHSFLKCNSLLLHVVQESVSAKFLTHSSWNLCKPILAVALRGYSPQSLTSVQFSTCAAQHISNSQIRTDWMDLSTVSTATEAPQDTEHPSETWHLGPWLAAQSSLLHEETAWAEKVHSSHFTLEASVQRDRLWLLSLEMWHRVVTNFTMQTWSIENGHHCCFSVTVH